MAPVANSTPQSAPRRRGRPRKYPLPPDSEPPLKKQKYNGSASARNSLFGAANGSLTVPRVRPSRRHSDMGRRAARQHPSTPHRRNHDDDTKLQYGSTAVSQSDTYKPREERSWDEFHPDLDIDLNLPVYRAEEVDGPGTPSQNGQLSGSPVLGQALQMLQQQNRSPSAGTSALMALTPIKRRPGRPPKRPEAMIYGLGSPQQRIAPAPLQNPKERLVLPKPNFRRIDTFAAYEKSPGVGINFVEKTFANVGYQESDIFSHPRTMIRGGKSSLEDENEANTPKDDLLDAAAVLSGTGNMPHPKVRVEYDMDEQDERWLEVINAERTANGVDIIRPQYFEIAMTLIEKEWHALEKRIPKPNPKPPQTHRPRSNSAAAVNGEQLAGGEEQDSKCAVCDDGDCENTNAIVFCDGCDLAVHQECYGVPFIPEGQWLCRKCQLIGRNTSSAFPHMCIFCPNVEGAFKQTSNMKWAHLLCAIWIPEVSIGNHTFMEPIQDVEKVPKQRWKLTCYICQQKMGACIQCSNKNCYLAFHVTCARRCRLQLKMKNSHGGIAEKNTLKGYCDKHVPGDWRMEHNVEVATEEAKDYYRRHYKGRRWADSQQTALAVEQVQETTENDHETNDDPFAAAGNNKRKKALLKKIWRLPSGAPIVPQIVYNNVEGILARWQLRKRKEFVAEACKYWTLKREARRGASLLKRLQLQLETFTSMEMTRRNFAAMGAAGGPKLQKRIEFAESLEKDLEQVRALCERAHERETLKIKDSDLLREIVDTVYFPITPLLWPILEKAQLLDSNYNYFKKRLSDIQQKLEQRYYISVSVFASDLGQALNEVVFSQSACDGEEFPPKPVSEQLNANDRAKHKDTQKDRLARAKRIIKSITPDLLEAASKEAELGLKSVDEERHNLSSILDNSLHPNLESRHGNTDVEAHDGSSEGGAEHQILRQIDVNGQRELGNGLERQINGAADEDVEMEDMDDDTDPKDDVEKENAVHLVNGLSNSDTDAGASHHTESHDEGEADHATRIQITPALNVPALSNSGSTNHSTTTHEPLTPTDGEKEITTLTHGGVPWYLEEFEPQGTTIFEPKEDHTHEEHASNTDALRGISEELSELDDDVVNGLVDGIGKPPMSVGSGNTLAVPTSSPKKKPKSKRKRW